MRGVKDNEEEEEDDDGLSNDSMNLRKYVLTRDFQVHQGSGQATTTQTDDAGRWHGAMLLGAVHCLVASRVALHLTSTGTSRQSAGWVQDRGTPPHTSSSSREGAEAKPEGLFPIPD